MQFEQRQNESSAAFARQLGNAAMLMMQSKNYQFFAVMCMRVWIQPAIVLKQIKFFFDADGVPAGYVTWAFMAADTEHRFIHDPKVLLHDSEWIEGERLWIMDFVARKGAARAMLGQIRETMFLSFTEARSLRRRPDGTVRCVNVWRRHVKSDAGT